MAEFRWILVALGLTVLVVVYMWSRRRSGTSRDGGTETRVEPRLDGESERPADPTLAEETRPGLSRPGETGLLFEDLPVAEPTGSEPPGPVAENPPERILVIHIRAINQPGFPGSELVAALEAEGMEYAEPGAFVQQSDQGQTLFTVANMFEPGSIPKDAPEDFVTPGVTAFMVLPGPGNAETVARMVAMARRLGSRLTGEVLDEAGSTLTNQRATHMREEVIEFQRRSQISASEH